MRIAQVTKNQLIDGAFAMFGCSSVAWITCYSIPANEAELSKNHCGVETGGELVLYAGRLSKEKTMDALLRAFTRRAGEHPKASSVVAGDGPHRRAFVRSSKSPGIIFIGWKQGEELAALFGSADVFALPSTTEALSLVGLEPRASAIPVPAMNVGGVRDAAEHKRTGLLANSVQEFRQGLYRLVEDVPLRATLGLNGRRYAEDRTWSHAFESLERNYLEAVMVRHENGR